MGEQKRTKNDAAEPIEKECNIDVSAIWEKDNTVSEDMAEIIMRRIKSRAEESL